MTTETPVPFDMLPEIQAAVVVAMLDDADAFQRLAPRLKPDAFTAPDVKAVASVVLGIFARHGVRPTFAAVVDECLSIGLPRERIDAVLSVDPRDKGPAVDRALMWVRSRETFAALAEAQEMYSEAPGDEAQTRMIVDRVCSLAAVDVVGGVGVDAWAPDDYLADEEWMERMPTGIAALDAELSGGLGVGEVGCVLAPPNFGKSLCLVEIAKGAALGRKANVLIVSLEMSERIYARRVASSISNVPMAELSSKRADVTSRLRAIRSMNVAGRIRIKAFPSRSATIRDVDAFIENTWRTENWKPDLVILDYLNEVKPTTKTDHRLELSEIAGEFRRMVGERQIRGWTATRTRRDARGKARIEMEDTAEDYEIFSILDLGISMSATAEEAAANRFRFVVIRNRDGRGGASVPMIKVPDRMRLVFDDSREDDPTAEA